MKLHLEEVIVENFEASSSAAAAAVIVDQQVESECPTTVDTSNVISALQFLRDESNQSTQSVRTNDSEESNQSFVQETSLHTALSQSKMSLSSSTASKTENMAQELSASTPINLEKSAVFDDILSLLSTEQATISTQQPINTPPQVPVQEPVVSVPEVPKRKSPLEILWRKELEVLADIGFDSEPAYYVTLLQKHLGSPVSLTGDRSAVPKAQGIEAVITEILGWAN